MIIRMSNPINGYTWEQAAENLSAVFARVPTAEIVWLKAELEAGRVNGSLSWVSDGYGCFCAKLGDRMPQTQDEGVSTMYLGFKQVYGTLPDHEQMEIFEHWLYYVRSGDTPETNVIAAAFRDRLDLILKERAK